MLIKIEIKPRAVFRPYLERKQRFAVIVSHRRAGKTYQALLDLIAKAIEAPKEEGGKQARYSFINVTEGQVKDVAWGYLVNFLSRIPRVQFSINELSATLPHNGARVKLYGAHNYERMRGTYNHGVVIDEMGDQHPAAWSEVIRPTLLDTSGWATFIGTPKGRNEFWRLSERAKRDPDWFHLELRASETGIISPDDLEAIQKDMTDEAYRREFECSFDAATLGAYYAKEVEIAEKEGRICRVLHEKAADVYAAWDLGISDDMAIWTFQRVGQEWHFLEYYSNSGEGLDHYVDWSKDRPYKINTHILPHDVEQRELQTGESRKQFLIKRGLTVLVVPQHNVHDGINAVRLMLHKAWFNSEGCEMGLDALRMYRSEYDDKHQVLRPRPVHDWASHGADAFRYAVMGSSMVSGNTKIPPYRRVRLS